MAEYNPSKIIKDGNTYNFRDTTKIPLAGSNQISGDLIPATTNAYDLGGSSYQWNNAYIKSLTINGVACGDILTHNANEFVDVSSAQTIAGVKTFSSNVIIQGSKKVTCNLDNSFIELDGGTTWGKGGSIVLSGQDRSSYTNSVLIVSKSDTNTDILQYQNGELKPHSNNTNNPSLGTPTNKWSKVYSDDVVHTTNNETISGVKTFSSGGCIFFKQIKINHNLEYGKNNPPSQSAYHNLMFTDANDWWGSYIENVIDTSGNSTLAFYVRNTNDIQSRVYLKSDINGSFSMFPLSHNVWDLGTSTNKWKSINGINPGALSLPSMAYISLDTTNFDVTATTIGAFTPTIDGWAILSMSQRNKPFGIWVLQGSYRTTFQSVHHQGDYMIFALIPVWTNLNLTIYCTADDIDSTRKVDWLRLFPCQGNV